jgi:hypothetical protein
MFAVYSFFRIALSNGKYQKGTPGSGSKKRGNWRWGGNV